MRRFPSSLEQALDETRLALQQQLVENAELSQRNAGLQANCERLNARKAEHRPLLDVIEQSVKQLKEMP